MDKGGNTIIGVLSDTHIYTWPAGLLQNVDSHFAGAEMILHAGDIVNPVVLDALPAPVTAVSGNSDSPVVSALLPARRVVRINGFTIGLTHGYGPPEGLVERVRRQFDQVDAIVFGHSHVAFMGEADGVFMFNPGSLTSPRDGRGSMGILRLNDTISGMIIRL